MSTDLAVREIANSLTVIEEHRERFGADIEKTLASLRRAEALRAQAHELLAQDAQDSNGLLQLQTAARYESKILRAVLSGLTQSYTELAEAKIRLAALANPDARTTAAIQAVQELLVLHSDLNAFTAQRARLIASEISYAEKHSANTYAALMKEMHSSDKAMARILNTDSEYAQLAQIFHADHLRAAAGSEEGFGGALAGIGFGVATSGGLSALGAAPITTITVALGTIVLTYLLSIRKAYLETLREPRFSRD